MIAGDVKLSKRNHIKSLLFHSNEKKYRLIRNLNPQDCNLQII